MSPVDFAEKVTSEALANARSAYDLMHERVYKFATLLASGAGGAGVYALGKVGDPGALVQVVPLAALSVWWFLIAGAVLLHGAASRPLKVGTSSAAVRARMQKNLEAAGSEPAALWNTRWEHLAAVDQQIEQYAKGCSVRARALDKAYWCVVCSPVIALIGYLASVQRG